MMIVSVQFTGMVANKKKEARASTEAKNNLTITNITSQSIDDLTKKQRAAKVEFVFYVDYAPEVAKIELAGAAVYLNTEEKIDLLVKKWQKEKKMEKEFIPAIFNHLLTKCNIKALSIEEELALPFHLPIPRVKTKTSVKGEKLPAAS